MADEKDRLGDRLKERETAEENRYFAAQDRAALDKLRAQQNAGIPQASCPRCGAALVEVDHVGIKVDRCPSGHGMWLDQGEFDVVAKREKDSWLGRLLPKIG